MGRKGGRVLPFLFQRPFQRRDVRARDLRLRGPGGFQPADVLPRREPPALGFGERRAKAFDFRQRPGQSLLQTCNPGPRRLRFPGPRGLQPGDFVLSCEPPALDIGKPRRQPPDLFLRAGQRPFQSREPRLRRPGLSGARRFQLRNLFPPGVPVGFGFRQLPGKARDFVLGRRHLRARGIRFGKPARLGLLQPSGEAVDFRFRRRQRALQPGDAGFRRIGLFGARRLKPGDFLLPGLLSRFGVRQPAGEAADFDFRRRQRLLQRGDVGGRRLRLLRQRRFQPRRLVIGLGERAAGLAQRGPEPLRLGGLRIALGPERGQVLLQRRARRQQAANHPVELRQLLRLRGRLLPARQQRGVEARDLPGAAGGLLLHRLDPDLEGVGLPLARGEPFEIGGEQAARFFKRPVGIAFPLPRVGERRLQRIPAALERDQVALQTLDFAFLDLQPVPVGGRAVRQPREVLAQQQDGAGGLFGFGRHRLQPAGIVVARLRDDAQLRRQRLEVVAQVGAGRLLERQHLGELGKLAVQPRQRLVAPGERLVQEELRQNEDHDQEDDDHQQARQRVHEARPGVDVPSASARPARHVCAGCRGPPGSEAQNVAHGVKAGRLARRPARRAERAAREQRAVHAAMGEFEPLALGDEHHRVLAHHIAAAQGREADIARAPRAGVALAAPLRDRVQIGAAPRRRRPPEADGRARGRIHLVLVVDLEDFDVVFLAEQARHALDGREQRVHRHAHIGRIDDGQGLRRLRERGLLPGVEAGGADDMARAGRGRHRRMLDGRAGQGEFDRGLGRLEHRFRVIAYGDAAAEVAPERRMARRLAGRGELQIVGRPHEFHQQPAHAPAGSDDANPHFLASGSCGIGAACSMKRPEMTETRIYVIGNEKGGTGKSTVAFNLVVGLLRAGRSVGCIDLDPRQATLSRQVENRRAYAERTGTALPLPEVEIADAPEALDGALEALAARHDAVVVDTPGRPDPAAQRAHAHADVLITPLNDSHVDLDLIGRLEPGTRNAALPGVYAEMVWKQRMVRAGAGRRALDWIVMLNRVRQVDAHNTREIRSLLQDLAGRFAFDIAPGFGERMIFREMFPDGIGLMDLRQPGVERTLSMSHVAARNEVRRLLDLLGVPPV